MYARGKFGIEYNPVPPEPDANWIVRALVVLAITGSIALTASLVGRWRRAHDGTREVLAAEREIREIARQGVEAAPVATMPAATEEVREKRLPAEETRPVKVRNLLMRLAEAEKRRDLEMAVTTIEQLRSMPEAADLDDSLARRLGVLNLRRLFRLKSPQWTEQVTVRRGDSVSRIAYEHASTLASLKRLNDGGADKVKPGQKLTVLNHPRFNLVVSRRSRTADLSLNGKFFKRYYLPAEVTGVAGAFALGDSLRGFLSRHGMTLNAPDRAELEMLLPKGTPIYIKEI